MDCQAATVTSGRFHGSPSGDSLAFEAGWTLPALANGYGGPDNLAAGDGNDELHGGSGNDEPRGNEGADRLFAKGDPTSYQDGDLRRARPRPRATLDRNIDKHRQVARCSY